MFAMGPKLKYGVRIPWSSGFFSNSPIVSPAVMGKDSRGYLDQTLSSPL